MSTEKKIDNHQILGPRILAGCMGFMIICAWAFAGPNAFKRPTIDVQLTKDVDSQTEETQITETPETETETTTTDTTTTATASPTPTIEIPETETEITTTDTTTATASPTATIETPETETTTTTTDTTATATASPTPTIETPETETTTTTTDTTTTATASPTPTIETPETDSTTTTDTNTASQSEGKDLNTPETLGQIRFDLNEVELSPQAEQTLQDMISKVKEYDPNKVIITVEGHTSKVGEAQVNLEISQDRADVVVEYLKQQNLPYQVVGKGMGYSKPLPNSDPADDVNQRTVIILTPSN